MILCRECKTTKDKSEFDLCANGKEPDNWCCRVCMELMQRNYKEVQDKLAENNRIMRDRKR